MMKTKKERTKRVRRGETFKPNQRFKVQRMLKKKRGRTSVESRMTNENATDMDVIMQPT